ncbi:putative lysosomal acid lipase/cholesteryl ester hydrolase isoform X2 [Halichondria panicea]
MGNVRGNIYSRNHTTLKPSQKEFWNFTFDEHAALDLPAMINYVLNTSQQSDLFYVGHSQGTIMGFAGFTINQTLAKQIKTFFALAPVTTVKYIKGLFEWMSEILVKDAIKWFFNHFGTGEFFPDYEILKILGKDLCTPDLKFIDGLCEDVLFLICGFDRGDTNITRLPVYYTHTPAGTSVKNTIHFAQEVDSGKFCKYDYGTKLNMQAYGMPSPPSYNVTELNVPTALFTGGNDWLADPTDVNASIPLLNTTGKVFFRKHIPKYDHLDFIWGLDSATLVYSDIIQLAKNILKL